MGFQSTRLVPHLPGKPLDFKDTWREPSSSDTVKKAAQRSAGFQRSSIPTACQDSLRRWCEQQLESQAEWRVRGWERGREERPRLWRGQRERSEGSVGGGCDGIGLRRSRYLKRGEKTVFLRATVYNALLTYTTDSISTLSIVCRGKTGTAVFWRADETEAQIIHYAYDHVTAGMAQAVETKRKGEGCQKAVLNEQRPWSLLHIRVY